MTTAAARLSEPARRFLDAGPHRLLIGDERLDAADGRTFATLDPATGQPIAEVAHAGPDDVDAAVRAARTAFEGPWTRLPAAERGRLLGRLAALVDEHAAELAELESLDNGKPVKPIRPWARPENDYRLRGWPPPPPTGLSTPAPSCAGRVIAPAPHGWRSSTSSRARTAA
jgi:hypothetical protein